MILSRFSKTKIVMSVVAILMLAVAAGCGGAGGGADTGKELVLGHIPSFTSTTLGNAAAKAVLEEAGYTVKLQEAEVGVIYPGLVQGSIDLFFDSWIPSHNDYWEAWGDDLERLGTVYDGALIAWIVPDYLTEVQSIEDLHDNLHLFDADGNGVGEVFSYGEGSGASITSNRAVEEYDLPYRVVDSSTAAMLAEYQSRLDNEEPFVGVGWRPHWMFDRWPIRYLEDPKEIFKPDTVYIVGAKGFAEENPELAKLLDLFEVPLSEFEEMSYKYTVENRDPEEIGQEWLEEHRDRIEGWIAEAFGD